MKRFAILLLCLVSVVFANAREHAQKPSEDINTIFGKNGPPHVG